MSWSPSVTLVTGNSITAAYWNATVGLANSPVLACAIMSASMSSYASGTTIDTWTTSGTLAFANGPTVASSSNLSPGTAGVYDCELAVNASWTGTMTELNLVLYANIGGTAYVAAQDVIYGSFTTAMTMECGRDLNLGASDYIYGVLLYSGGTAVTVNAVSQTFMSMAMRGVL